jgi:hypothetical protein
MRKKISMIALVLVLALSSVFVMAVPASAAVTSITVLSPQDYDGDSSATPAIPAGIPAATTQGGQVEVTALLEVTTADFYTVSLKVTDPADSDALCGSYSDLIYLNAGKTSISRMITVYVPAITDKSSIPATGYPLDLSAALMDFEGSTPTTDVEPTSIFIGLVPGSAIGTTLVSKVTILAEAILDKFVSPSMINDALISGSAFDALNDEGKSVVDGVGALAANGVGMAGEILQGIRATVSTRVPTIVNGALGVAAEVVGLFSTMTPWAP